MLFNAKRTICHTKLLFTRTILRRKVFYHSHRLQNELNYTDCLVKRKFSMKAVLENLVNWKIFLHFISTYVLIIGKDYFLEKKNLGKGYWAFVWCVDHSLYLYYQLCKSRKMRPGQAIKSTSEGKAAWADIANTKFLIARPEFILTDLTEFILHWLFQPYFFKSSVFHADPKNSGQPLSLNPTRALLLRDP